MNQVYIDQFPEAKDLLSTDQFIVFEKVEQDVYRPIVLTVADLSAFFIEKDYASVLSSKLEELEAKAKELADNLEKLLPRQSDLTSYSTISRFESEIGKLEKTSDFIAKLNGKADKTFLEAQYNLFLGKMQHLKAFLGGAGHDQGRYWGRLDGNSGYPYKSVLAGLAKQVAEGFDGNPDEQ